MTGRLASVAVLALALAAGCGGDGGSGGATSSPPTAGAAPAAPAALATFAPWTPPREPAKRTGLTLREVVGAATAENGLAVSQWSFTPGRNRLAFAVLTPDGRALAAPAADVYVGRGANAPATGPFPARLLPVVPPGVAAHEHSGAPAAVFVADVAFPATGRFEIAVVLRDTAGRRTTAAGAVQVVTQAQATEPRVGDRAPASETPTIASTGGDLAALTTRDPPDRALLRTSVADALRAHHPFVVMFATPAFCSTRVCGPAVDVLLALERRLRSSGVDLIHVEIYRGNDPDDGPNRWVREWGLRGEPATFAVGRDGRVVGVLQGPQTANELAALIERAAAA